MDSTNNYAMELAKEGKAGHGTLVFAHDQRAGKGQRGRSWESRPGENILLSAVLEPVAFSPFSAFGLSATVALACHDLFSRYAGPEAMAIKWPNDLYWNDRKAGGILIENQFTGMQWVLAIAGIGININQVVFGPATRNPVSLRQITGRVFDVPALARELGGCLDRRYAQWESGQSLISEYNGVVYRRGQEVRLRKDNAVFKTRVEGVSAEGELITKDVIERRFVFGEVEWVI